MTRDDVLATCLAYRNAVEDYPFGDEVAVFKVGGRMFALVSLDGELGSVHLKCDPGLALELRERYPAIRGGYHLNKRPACQPRGVDAHPLRSARRRRPVAC